MTIQVSIFGSGGAEGVSVFGSSKNLVKGDAEQPLITVQIFSLLGGAKVRATPPD